MANPKVEKVIATMDTLHDFNKVVNAYEECRSVVTVSTITRLILLVVAWINQFLAIFGTYQIPTLSDAETCIIASGITIAITLFAYWYNNSWSGDAVVCDTILAMFRDAGIDEGEILNAIKTIATKTESDIVKQMDDKKLDH